MIKMTPNQHLEDEMSVIDWILTGEPWVRYRTYIDLLGRSPEDAEMQALKEEMITHPLITALIKEGLGWPGNVLNSHKSANQTYHRAALLADLGLTVEESAIARICEIIMSRQSEEGPFPLTMNIPAHFGGSGKDEWAWALCDAPVVSYALIRFGCGDDPRVRHAVDYLCSLMRDNGWPCAVSKNLGRFRGPGKKDDPCPYATLVMLKMLIALNDERYVGEIETGAKVLLQLWQNSRERHPYMFFMGNDFRKLKAPLIWYDILHVVEVLSGVPYARSDARFQEMLDLILSKSDSEGKYTPESVYQAFKAWDFGQKKQPSRWLTFLVTRIKNRVEQS